MPILIRTALTAGVLVLAACSSSGGGKGAAYFAGGATSRDGSR